MAKKIAADPDFCMFCRRPMNEEEQEGDVNHLIVKLALALNASVDPLPDGVHNLPGQIEIFKNKFRSIMGQSEKVVVVGVNTKNRRVQECIEAAIPPAG